MAIGKKSSGSRRAIGAESDAAKAEKKRLAAQLAQKAAQENIAANRQLESARAHAATPGRADAQLTRAQLISAPTPSRLKDRQRHDREMQAERLAHSASESKLAREHSASESKLNRDHQLHMQDISLWNQRFMNTERLNADKEANRERNASLERMREIDAKKAAAGNAARLQIEAQKGQNAIALEAQRGKNKLTLEQQKGLFGAGRDAAKYRHELEKLGIKNENDLAKWYRQQEYEEQQRIDAEDMQHGIPVNSGISPEDRAKIINGKGAYKFEWSRTKKEEDDIKHYEEQINSPKATEEDRRRLQKKLDEYKAAHPAKGKAVETPVEEREPQTTVINGVTYMNNNGRWEMVQTPKQEAPVPTEPQIITREDGTKWLGNGKGGFTPYTDPKDAARQKYMQDLLKAEEMARYDEVVLGKKNTPPITQRVNPVTGLMEVAFNGAPTNPMATPTPTPETTVVMPPNEKGESAIVDSTGNAIGYVDAQGAKWKIIYGKDGRPIGKVLMQ